MDTWRVPFSDLLLSRGVSAVGYRSREMFDDHFERLFPEWHTHNYTLRAKVLHAFRLIVQHGVLGIVVVSVP
jgi:hypothetical protein